MRSSVPQPGDPWPHDMVITITDDAQTLLELLWVREAWGLDPAGDDLPPALIDTPDAVSAAQRAAAPIAEWRTAWPGIWAAALRHAATPRDPAIFERLQQTGNGSEERARLLSTLVGPSWYDDVGPEAITDAAHEWRDALVMRRMEGARAALEEQPERASLDALIPAWRAGLTTIVEIPCRGEHTRPVGPHGLLVTSGTRADPALYSAALARFR